jgi:ankyrin repeat protein
MRTKIYLPVFVLVSFLGLIVAGDAIRSQAQANLHSDYQLLVKSLRGDSQAVRSLLQHGVDPNTPPGPNDRGMTALMFAAWIGDSQTVRLLAEAGADVNAKSNSGATPLMYAAMSGDAQSLQLLLAKGADPNLQEQSGMTALMYAVRKGEVQGVRVLAKNESSNLSLRALHGDTALLLATKKGSWQVVEVLLQANPGLEDPDRFGQTPLMNAARTGNLGILLRLLDKGANVNARDANGATALTKATLGNHPTAVRALQVRGGRP